jgi:tetratricopeptide (TPR) repeat protein
VIYIDRGQLQQALLLYDKLLLLNPNDLELLASMANLYYNLREYQHVVLILNRMLSLAPQHPDALANLALAYEKLARRDEALDAFQRAIQTNPDDIDLVFLYARHQYNRGNFQEAIRLFDQVLQNRPNDFECLANISSSYLSMAKQERQKLQKAGEAMLALADIQRLRDAALTSYRQAIPYLERALKLRSDRPVLWRNLGVAYIAIGEKEKGTNAFLKAESLQAELVN